MTNNEVSFSKDSKSVCLVDVEVIQYNSKWRVSKEIVFYSAVETQIWKDNMTNNEVSFSKDSKSVLIDQVGRNWYNISEEWEKFITLFDKTI